MKRLFLALLSMGLFLQCSDGTEYSPNQAFDNDSPKDINLRNIERLQKAPIDDTLSIIFIGDSQRFYDEVEAFVGKANLQKNVDVVIIAGDISDFGLLEEFEWITRSLDKLNAPYLGVIGNHDVVANGESVFERMFGPLDFSFTYDSIRFVFHNTNSREYKGAEVPNLPWLDNAFAPDPAVKHFIGVSHVPPFHPDFNPNLEHQYRQILKDNPNFLVSLHGHIHKHTDEFHYQDGIRFITGHYFLDRKFLRLDIHKGQITKTILEF